MTDHHPSPQGMDQALEYCRNRVLAPASRLSMTVGFIPEAQRTARIAFHALLADLADTAGRISDPGVARTKLGWWQEELQRSRDGQPRHPVTRALVEEKAFGRLSSTRLNELLSGIAASQDLPAFRNLDALRGHCEQLGGVAAALELELAGIDDPQHLSTARVRGSGQYLTRLLLDLRSDAAEGRWWLPREIQARFDLDRSSLLAGEGQSEEMVRMLAASAEAWLCHGSPSPDRHLRIQQALDLRLARRCLNQPGRCVAGKVGRQPVRETFLAWRTARQQVH